VAKEPNPMCAQIEAWMEQPELTDQERSEYQLHLRTCGECRDLDARVNASMDESLRELGIKRPRASA